MLAPTMVPLLNVNRLCDAISLQIAQGRVAGTAQPTMSGSPAVNSRHLKIAHTTACEYHMMLI
jgi:hypothetical protein